MYLEHCTIADTPLWVTASALVQQTSHAPVDHTEMAKPLVVQWQHRVLGQAGESLRTRLATANDKDPLAKRSALTGAPSEPQRTAEQGL